MPWSNSNSFTFTDASIKTYAPQVSGVYALYTSKQWVYFGEANDIRRRLLEHLNGNNSCITRAKPEAFSFETWPENQRVQRQDALILELHPVCNKKLG
jgi:predicted GIY-YIG superfamily endonuclease